LKISKGTKRTNNDLQNTVQETKDRATRTPLKTWSELGWSAWVARSGDFFSLLKYCKLYIIGKVLKKEMHCTLFHQDIFKIDQVMAYLVFSGVAPLVPKLNFSTRESILQIKI